MTQELVVWCEGREVGLVAVIDGGWQFAYSHGWLDDPGNFPLSPAFPLRDELITDSAEVRPVQWFFDNLLPEGGVRAALARHAGLHAQDSFGLLARYGEESAGALTLLPPGEAFPTGGSYRQLPEAELKRLIDDLPKSPLIAAGGRLKMSLAGAQHKLPIHWDGAHVYLPEGAWPSTHILKPEHARPQDFPMTPANEHFCMQLAREVGLPVPATWLLHRPAPIYLCQRYDRTRAEPGKVRRLHQIDLLQLINKWRGYKYEAEGGATLGEVFAALALTRQPAVAKNHVLRWIVFNYLIGNSDAHAKNLSFVVRPDGIVPAPSYDLLCVKVYGDHQMAMAIGQETRYDWIGFAQWDALARDAVVLPSLVRRICKELATKFVPAAERLAQALPFSSGEASLIARIVDIIGDHANYIHQALAEKPPT